MTPDRIPISVESCRRATAPGSITTEDLEYACRLAQRGMADLADDHRQAYTVFAETDDLLICLVEREDYWTPTVHQSVRPLDEEGRLDPVGDETLAELLRSAHDHEFRSERVRSITGLSKAEAVDRTMQRDAILIRTDHSSS